jgi:hypothetical protein
MTRKSTLISRNRYRRSHSTQTRNSEKIRRARHHEQISNEERRSESFHLASLFKSPEWACKNQTSIFEAEELEPSNEWIVQVPARKGSAIFCFDIADIVKLFARNQFFNPWVGSNVDASAKWNRNEIKIFQDFFLNLVGKKGYASKLRRHLESQGIDYDDKAQLAHAMQNLEKYSRKVE